MSGFENYLDYDGLGLAALIARRAVSAAEVLEAAIARTEACNPDLNAVIHTCYARARTAAREGLPDGPLHGVPILLKDYLSAFAGEPMTMGSRGIRWVPSEDTEMVRRLRASGVNIFGKTNLPEFGLTITTEPKAHGPTHNPHRHGYSAGGSSGGSAAAVAAGLVPIASANDGGGSIRFPAAWCGVVGLKPTRGRTPVGPGVGALWSGAVVEGVVSRTVRDTAAALDATAGPELGALHRLPATAERFVDTLERDPRAQRIGVLRRPLIGGAMHPEVSVALEHSIETLAALGHHVEDVELPLETSSLWRSFMIVIASHTAHQVRMLRAQFGARAVRALEPATKNLAMLGRSVSGADFVTAEADWHHAQFVLEQALMRCDLLWCPTVPTPPVRLGTLLPTRLEERILEWSSHLNVGRLSLALGLVEPLAMRVLGKMGFTLLANITGAPAISLPLARTHDGLPIGLQAIGGLGDEARLLALAAQLERAGAFQPPVFAPPGYATTAET